MISRKVTYQVLSREMPSVTGAFFVNVTDETAYKQAVAREVAAVQRFYGKNAIVRVINVVEARA